VSIVRVGMGENPKYAEGYAAIFGKKKAEAAPKTEATKKSDGAKKAPAAKAKKPAKKK
jgi:hypothetical protein